MMIMRKDYSVALTVWKPVCAIVFSRSDLFDRSEEVVFALPMVLLHGLGDLSFVS